MKQTTTNKIPLGVSERLLQVGTGTESANHSLFYFSRLLVKYFELRSFSLQTEQQLIAAPEQTEQSTLMSGICGYIVKKQAPVADRPSANHLISSPSVGEGLSFFALQIMHNQPLLPVEEGERLFNDYQVRESFFERVSVIYRWRCLQAEGLTAQRLLNFHARHKLMIMCHGDYRDLGQLLADLNKNNLAQVAEQYIAQLMMVLMSPVSRSNHVNVLQHIQGYLKKGLSRDDKIELCELIECYRCGGIPLMAPLTLLKHHFRKAPDPYIQESYYMSPYPDELNRIDTKFFDESCKF